MQVKSANQAIELDHEILLNASLQRRIQIYAEQLTDMEVQYTVRSSLSAFDLPHYKGMCCIFDVLCICE